MGEHSSSSSSECIEGVPNKGCVHPDAGCTASTALPSPRRWKTVIRALKREVRIKFGPNVTAPAPSDSHGYLGYLTMHVTEYSQEARLLNAVLSKYNLRQRQRRPYSTQPPGDDEAPNSSVVEFGSFKHVQVHPYCPFCAFSEWVARVSLFSSLYRSVWLCTLVHAIGLSSVDSIDFV